MENDTAVSWPSAKASADLNDAGEAPAAAANGDAVEGAEETLRKRLLAEAEGLDSDNEVYEFSEGETVRPCESIAAAVIV